MELRQLKYFVRIVEAGSVSRASQSLHVAQPALSSQLGRLEDELGTKLLTRSVRGVVPTEAGAAVYRQAQLILKQVDATHLIASQADAGPAGRVAIGLPWTVTSVLGLSLLTEVSTELKAVRLEVVEGPSSVLAQMLAQGKLDLAVLFDNTTDGGLRMQPVVAEPLLLVGARGTLTGRSSATLQEVAALPLLLLSRPNGIREEIERIWAVHEVKPNVVAEINAPGLLIEAVKAGLGFSVLPSCAMEEQLRRGDIDALELEGGSLTRTVYLSTSRLFALTRAAEHVYMLVEQLMKDAIDKGDWTGRLLAEAPEPS
ncbi:LysR substrate-binding domain-containing protein [Variovorax sp. J22R24]|uniref:LysR substrate-binding domain-containing protein n=1 Tax=Variovorax gracilis TaxID=3053502 RepID=UPI002577A640|nr:LysR substrate-binding domain-containing protein [Variovorax sp. J22R24]MDM0108528.1 LysR substrate-binding domain-containing protein [Variovorax sp. J22R24]